MGVFLIFIIGIVVFSVFFSKNNSRTDNSTGYNNYNSSFMGNDNNLGEDNDSCHDCNDSDDCGFDNDDSDCDCDCDNGSSDD